MPVQHNTEKNIEQATTAGIALLDKGKVAQAIEAVCKPLDKVGPATATAILAPLAADGAVPFFSDELCEVVTGTRDYTPARLHACIAYLQKKCSALNRLREGGGEEWTPERLQQAMWAYGHTHCHGDAGAGAYEGGVRKRAGGPANDDGRAGRAGKRSKGE